MSATSDHESVPVNLAVLRGVCSGPAEVRVLESGTRLAAFAVRVPAADGTTSVPVTVWAPASTVETLGEGDAVTVVGRVRRRFFRRPDGGPGTRVDVEAERVVVGRDRRRVAAAHRAAVASLEPLDE